LFVVDEEELKQEKGRRALQTVHRVDRLTRSLQRRLTRRTLAQVTSLRQHAMDAITVILGLAKSVNNTLFYILRLKN